MEEALGAATADPESAAPADPAPQTPPPVVLGSEDSTSVSVPDVPVTVITEVLGRGRRCRATAHIIDGDIPPNTQLGFGWLLVSSLLI